jgi:hypothetical protein
LVCSTRSDDFENLAVFVRTAVFGIPNWRASRSCLDVTPLRVPSRRDKRAEKDEQIFREATSPKRTLFSVSMVTPNSQNNTDTLKYQNGLSNVVNDKGRCRQPHTTR